MREWIDVNDRLPDNDDYVWVTLDNDGHRVTTKTWYSQHYKCWGEFDDVVAWMPIEKSEPEPYDPNKN